MALVCLVKKKETEPHLHRFYININVPELSAELILIRSPCDTMQALAEHLSYVKPDSTVQVSLQLQYDDMHPSLVNSHNNLETFELIIFNITINPVLKKRDKISNRISSQ